MPDIDNNMDDLFRKAAHNYQVKPGESRWDKVVPQLNNPVIDVPAKKTNSKKYTGFFLLAFITIFSVISIVTYYHQSNQRDIAKTSVQNKKSDTYKKINRANNKRSYPLAGANDQVTIANTKSKNYPVIDAGKKIIGQSKNIVELIQVNNDAMVSNDLHKYEIEKIATNLHDKNVLSSSIGNATDTSAANQLNTAKNVAKKSETVEQKKKHPFYITFTAGLAFNEVKSQGLQKPGLDLGITAGFSFNKNTSVEAGALFSKKYYYTDVKYFNTDKVMHTMPAGMHVLNLHGSSTMLAIPIRLKYNLINNNKADFFAAAGISSYVMLNEKNNYHTMMNGAEEDYSASYKNSSNSFASTFDISVGYEKYVGKKNNKIRIEPYIQFPLKGMGVGELPVTSAGLHAGYTFSP